MPVRDQTLSKRQARDIIDITENASAIGGTNNGDFPALTQVSADLTDNGGGSASTTIADLSDGTTYANDHTAIENAISTLAAQADAHTVEVTFLIAAVRELAVRVNELLDRSKIA